MNGLVMSFVKTALALAVATGNVHVDSAMVYVENEKAEKPAIVINENPNLPLKSTLEAAGIKIISKENSKNFDIEIDGQQKYAFEFAEKENDLLGKRIDVYLLGNEKVLSEFYWCHDLNGEIYLNDSCYDDFMKFLGKTVRMVNSEIYEEILKYADNNVDVSKIAKICQKEDLQNLKSLGDVISEKGFECMRYYNGAVYFVYKTDKNGYAIRFYDSLDKSANPVTWYGASKCSSSEFAAFVDNEMTFYQMLDNDPNGDYAGMFVDAQIPFSYHFATDGYVIRIEYEMDGEGVLRGSKFNRFSSSEMNFIGLLERDIKITRRTGKINIQEKVIQGDSEVVFDGIYQNRLLISMDAVLECLDADAKNISDDNILFTVGREAYICDFTEKYNENEIVLTVQNQKSGRKLYLGQMTVGNLATVIDGRIYLYRSTAENLLKAFGMNLEVNE